MFVITRWWRMQYWWLYDDELWNTDDYTSQEDMLSSLRGNQQRCLASMSRSVLPLSKPGQQGLWLFQILLMMMISLVMSLKAKITGSASGTSDIFLESKCQMVRSSTNGLPKEQIIITMTGFSMETMIWSCTRQYTWTGGRLIIEDGTFWKIQIGEVQHKQNNLIQQNELNRTH